MVGYVEDGAIGSSVRIRFDAGYGITAPDRGEFFYAKCGCYRGLPPDHPCADPAAPGYGPGIVTDMNFQQFYLMGEYAFSNRLSAFGELPIRRVNIWNVRAGHPQARHDTAGPRGIVADVANVRERHAQRRLQRPQLVHAPDLDVQRVTIDVDRHHLRILAPIAAARRSKGA